jgi:hypothetical protein
MSLEAKPEAPREGSEHIIAEIDGTMLPVVVTEKGSDHNARKHRTCQWEETKLCAAREPHLETSAIPDEGAPVRIAIRYLTKRIDQLE